ncbi:aspartate--tRNA ligase [Candidatus Falkowbacteria bacterium CG10_big_fil_rev_8_21_14_0_10_43_10]|uniref:Aspartate--tRNA(Asp/Asn) ligase n=1 Tax=Candidatus Falkowbacteria bacterium CG10_big_fil_rev_8_21_14_0_10_43_10 TaxID=1974567 RepID=A0A2H0V333_9BACT|nr:MAG: aspartate--tRNA ligase [Candidatus Falkowbacteria bacterium CG10_big_fil_rev_8_21_14_0_10_43_10]
MLRTHTCGELTAKSKGEKVTLCGWVHRRRDHGGLIFIDLRDRYGLTQLTIDPGKIKEADKLRNEWVIKAAGKVAERPEEMINKKLKTGGIEVEISGLEILSESKTPPFSIDEDKNADTNENLRLKYRFIDLRRPKLQEMLRVRDEVIQYIRAYFHKNDFLEVQTPILANSSPEGARDWLVPSRLYPGKFYALPQAPQQFKQLLMVAGVDRYFQIAPCFRDEDPRADRHFGEFYQLDMEMSFVEQEDIFKMMEPLMIELTEKFSPKKVMFKPFPRIPWKEAMTKYGSDKPDLRFEMEIKPVTEIVKNCGFSIFTDAIKSGGVVHALNVSGGAKFSRKEIDEITEVAKAKGAKGLAYIALTPNPSPKGRGELYEAKSPVIKFLGADLVEEIIKRTNAKAGDIIFFGADKWRTVCESLGAVRSECGARLGLKDPKKAAWLWVTDFPMYDYSEIEKGKIDFGHNPFSMPQGGLEALQTKDPLEILAYQYDFVLNGFEITSGAIRNHDPKIMYKAFAIAGYTKEQVDKKFGHMIRAFEYGAPPHGGNAPGIDRLLMVINDWNSIRDIYAFPKDGAGRDVMLDAPSEVEEKQLKELHLKINKG